MFLVNCFYNVILTWAIYYFFASFTRNLPWDSCGNDWNTDMCRLTKKVGQAAANTTHNFTTETTDLTTATPASITANWTTPIAEATTYAGNQTTAAAAVFLDPTIEFWELVGDERKRRKDVAHSSTCAVYKYENQQVIN